jgi:hypothetical protein
LSFAVGSTVGVGYCKYRLLTLHILLNLSLFFLFFFFGYWPKLKKKVNHFLAPAIHTFFFYVVVQQLPHVDLYFIRNFSYVLCNLTSSLTSTFSCDKFSQQISINSIIRDLQLCKPLIECHHYVPFSRWSSNDRTLFSGPSKQEIFI